MTNIASQLGAEAEFLLGHVCRGIPRENLHLPGPDFIERVLMDSDRKPGVLRSSRHSSTRAASPAAAIFRCCPSTRASSIPAALPLRPIQTTSILPTS